MKTVKVRQNVVARIKDDLSCVGHWPSNASPSTSVPIYHVKSPHAFNQIIGYAKFINGGNGTVLYRGQNENHPNLLPSGARNGNIPVPDSTIIAIRSDKDIAKFFCIDNEEINGWDRYQSIIIESALQHYGANTYCMDFVDNHWCALWFGLYQFKDGQYTKRTGANENLYVYLYLADTNGPCICGMYIGEDTYTVDLRKALPSTFSRPSAQHGWIVRKHNRQKCDYNDQVICVLEINVDDAAKWLGDGELLSQANFFPTFTLDQGYRTLLSRQIRSGVPSTWKKILPQKTICNYHYLDTYYVSDHTANPQPILPTKSISSLTELYSLLLERGWSKDTCAKNTLWSEENPVVGQSAVTALLVQKLFGGEILSFPYSNSTHYFNCIDGCFFDLTFEELNQTKKKSYPPQKYDNLGASPKRPYKTHGTKLDILINNCGI